eukprot:5863375-Amphidinium_carterae.2
MGSSSASTSSVQIFAAGLRLLKRNFCDGNAHEDGSATGTDRSSSNTEASCTPLEGQQHPG